jgi:hypothetical protein
MIELREIPFRLRVAFKARDIYNLAHKLRSRQVELEAHIIHDFPAEQPHVQLTLIAWDRQVSEFFAKHPDMLKREAVWLDLVVADELLLTLQNMYDAGGRLWAFLAE